MLILGVDPGLALCGLGYLQLPEVPGQDPTSPFYGAIETEKAYKGTDRTTAERLCELKRDLRAVLRERKPDHVAVEMFHPSPKLAHLAPMILQARGVVLVEAEERGIPIFEYTPGQVKQAVTGHGNAGKDEVRAAMAGLLGLDRIPGPDDAADGLAIAWCHYAAVASRLVPGLAWPR